ncbi:MAG: tRNA preQ1(34) S-adenosylmethionine ribosyltransferase-isomerase QueA [Proteobacteria bacterium]|nr:tRNA preQ1(34) S-adenosylmethionine ribosyltransferase-isomerase QueA [Pseudomonadota bacterium]
MKALLSDFDFDLPQRCIAMHPASPRDHARLLHVPGQGDFAHCHVYDLPGLLRVGDVLVVNNSKVILARLYGKRGLAKVEFLLHRRLKEEVWEAFARPAKRLRVNDEVVFAEGFSARVATIKQDGLVDLSFNQIGEVFHALLQRHGQVPLPPYIRRAQVSADHTDYQTIYARNEGSVAAPTAGLHFTPALLEKLKEKGVGWAQLTLHVGGGTFLPVREENIEAHIMHAEWGEVSSEAAATINATREKGGRVVAVGTTSCRLLETASDENGRLKEWRGETQIFIRPGYRFKAVDALLTNFHLPRSTLFMLTCAFAGTDRLKAAYAEAIAKDYRFYSYGDACFLERNP